jgi:hypothetical protein
MKQKSIHLFLLALILAVPAIGQDNATPTISGHYAEFRTADVYTGPCFANGEVNLTGHEAVLAWQIEKGAWNGVPLDGLSVVAVVRASATLGDPFSDPLPARTAFLVDARATEAQRLALIHFAQAQTGGLLNDVVAVDAVPIQFAMDVGGHHGYLTLEAGELVRLSTRALNSTDHLCTNEEVYYPPLAANLHHAMPVVAMQGAYRGNHLGVTWQESGRRGAFVASFAL